MARDPSVAERLAARLPADPRRRTHVAALCFGGVATLVAVLLVDTWLAVSVLGGSAEPTVDVVGIAAGLPLSAGLAAAAVAWPLWWLAVERPDRPTYRRGLLVGGAVGVLAHPPTWLLFGVGLAVVGALRPGPGVLASGGTGAAGLLGLYLLFTAVGLLLSGIVTVPVAAGTGAALAHVRATGPPERRRRPRGW